MEKEDEIEIPREHWIDSAVEMQVILTNLALNSKIQLENRVQTYNY